MQTPSFEEPTPHDHSYRIKAVVLVVLIGVALLAAALVFLPNLRESITARWAEPTVPAPPEAPHSAELSPLARPLQFTADFEQNTNRWDQSLSRVIDGIYEIRVDTPNYDTYGLYLGDTQVTSFDISTDVYQLAGDPSSEYGVRFHQSGPNTYTMFSLSSTGYYRLIEVREGSVQALVPWTFDGRINAGLEAVNEIALKFDGQQLSAWVNDARLISRLELEAVPGQFAFGVTTFDTGGTVVHFDQFKGELNYTNQDEDFSNAETAEWSIGGATIEDGSYELFAGPNLRLWQQPLPLNASAVGDVLIEVDALLVRASSSDSGYGLIFGDDGQFNFYTLFLSEDGHISLSHSRNNGSSTELLSPLSHSSILPGNNTQNRLRIEIDGQAISISINGSAVRTVQSSEPIRGTVGVVVNSETQARFDNLLIEER